MKRCGSSLVCSVAFAAALFSCTSLDPVGAGQDQDLSEDEVGRRSESREKSGSRLMDTVIGDGEDENSSGELPGPRRDSVRHPDQVVMVLPESVERITIDRFLRDRRTLMVRYLPLEPKFSELHQAFTHNNVLDDEASEALRQDILQNPQLGHWLFLHGSLVLQDALADPDRPLLLEQQRGIIAHFGRTLTFLARTLDTYQGAKRYEGFVKRLYVNVSRRYLYRDLRNRK